MIIILLLLLLPSEDDILRVGDDYYVSTIGPGWVVYGLVLAREHGGKLSCQTSDDLPNLRAPTRLRIRIKDRAHLFLSVHDIPAWRVGCRSLQHERSERFGRNVMTGAYVAVMSTHG